MSQKRKILFIAHSVDPGGGGEFDFELLLKWYFNKKDIYEVNALFPKGQNAKYLYKFCNKFSFYAWGYLPAHYIYGVGNYFKYLYKLSRQVSDVKNFSSGYNFDVCILNVSVILWPAIYLAYKKNKVIVFVRENIFPLFLRKIVYKVYDFLGVYVIANSINSMNDFRQITGSNRVSFIYPALEDYNVEEDNYRKSKTFRSDLTKESKMYGKNFRFVNIGSINKLKNQLIIIEALNELKKNKFDIPDIIFIGDFNTNDKYYMKIKHNIKKYNLEKNVIFTGKIPKTKVYDILLESDAVIISSITEGMPISMLESLRFGKPVLSTPVGGVREIIQDKENGFLFDNKYKLSSSMKLLSEDKQLYAKMCLQAKKTYFEIFNLSKSMDKLEFIIQSITK